MVTEKAAFPFLRRARCGATPRVISTRRAALAAAVLCTVPLTAQAHVTELRITSTAPFLNGESFGKTGAYVRIMGVAKGEIDPKSAQNASIVDLDKAPRNARGMVEYDVDITILKPADLSKGNGFLFYEVLNRGNKQVTQRLHDLTVPGLMAQNDPKTRAEVGNGFLFERGYTLVWSGWDSDVPKSNARMSARLPMAMQDGKPIVKRIRHEFQIGLRVRADTLTAKLVYPAATTDTTKARLTKRLRASDKRIDVPADRWEFADARSVRLLPKDTKFDPNAIYELWYDATNPVVLGVGYAATRDVVSFLRYAAADAKGAANPLRVDGNGVQHVLGFGGSQSGRFLRLFIEMGMNKDEQGQKVFDGVYSHTAGAGKVFGNHEFGMPARTGTQHEDHDYPENWFPFSTATATDPFSGKSGSILRGDSSDPKIIESNTSTEYWQKGASLLTVDPSGKSDMTLPANARVYLIAGTKHGGHAGLKPKRGVCVNMSNPHNPGPAMRALVVALTEWVADNKAPPPSMVPTLAAHTAVTPKMLEWPKAKDIVPPPGNNSVSVPPDWIDPAPSTQRYATFVTAIDGDGNEVAGIRLPDIAVPLATYTGWNMIKIAPSELCDREGTYAPFARTKAEREAAHDPRLSLEERYGTHDAFVAKTKAAADALVAQRLLLPADAAAYVKAAQQSDSF